MSTRMTLGALVLGATLSMLPPVAAHADTAADQAFMQRLVARQIIAGVAASGDTATIRALAPFLGADDGSMIDVARVVLRVYAAEASADGEPPTVTKVIVRDPGGSVIATFSESTGLTRG